MIFMLENEKARYDEVSTIVVRASGEMQARQLASGHSEGPWLDSTKTSCNPIDPNGPPDVLCREFVPV